MSKRGKVKHVIRSRADIPAQFENEAAEAAFWDSVVFTDEFLAGAERVPEGVLPATRGHTRPVAIHDSEVTT